MMKKVKFICLLILVYLSLLPLAKGQEITSKEPNIVLVLIDDMGFSDPGSYGGEIKTPNMDFLAENGLRFTNFHNAAKCSPTRASLLTGTYPHEAGMARIGRSLGTNVVTLAEVLKQGGYQTGMAGKWHLSITNGLGDKEKTMKWVGHLIDPTDVFAPLRTYPVNRGFDEHYGTIWGLGNHFDPFSLVHNEEPIKDVKEGFYDTHFFTKKSVDLIEKFDKKENPFFLYTAYTAPHWPLHAPQSTIEKYEGVYDVGWDSLRSRRYRRMVEMGLFDSQIAPLVPQKLNEGETHLSPIAQNTDWESYKYKDWEAAHMAIHAAMVDEVDQGIGKIIQKLKDLGKLENTLFMVMSDNGASPERKGKYPVFHKTKYLRNGDVTKYITSPTDGLPTGQEDTYAFLGRNWATAVNAPFRFWKDEGYEGGSATPFIVHWPEGLKTSPGTITDQFGHVMDMMPTLLDVTNIEYPIRFNGQRIIPYSGKSLVPIFNGEERDPYGAVFWEQAGGGKAVLKGNWKMSALGVGGWQLFNIEKDRTETNNLARIYPDKVREMEKLWNEWYESVTKPFMKR